VSSLTPDRDNEDLLVESTTELDLDQVAPTEDLVRVYLDGIGRTPLLDAAQEVELSKRIEAGLYAEHLLSHGRAADGSELDDALRAELAALVRIGADAKHQMLQANLRLVVSVAKKFSRRGVPFLDIVQEGNLGLIRAVEKFDYTKGYKFSTYAMWWIRQSIGRGLAEQARAVRLPVHVVEELSKLVRAERELSQQLGRRPTNAEIATQTGQTSERVDELRRVSRDPVSLDTPVGDDADTPLSDLVSEWTPSVPAPEEALLRASARADLDRALASLPELESTVLRLRYGLDDMPRGVDETGRLLGLTRPKVRSIEQQALARLRTSELARNLLDLAS
jgi:RNA polymerase sigma factor (sigma-70 family)